MKSQFLISFFLCSIVFGDLPRKRNHMELRNLWNNSPFTTKPEMESLKNELEDWFLAGVSASPNGGYMVTIVNKKDRTDRRRIHSSGLNSEQKVNGYKILKVSQGGYNYRDTKVKLALGSQEGWVTYDEKLLAIKPSVIIKPTATIRNTRPSMSPQMIEKANSQNPDPNLQNTQTAEPSTRRPRIRRVAPPPPN